MTPTPTHSAFHSSAYSDSRQICYSHLAQARTHTCPPPSPSPSPPSLSLPTPSSSSFASEGYFRHAHTTGFAGAQLLGPSHRRHPTTARHLHTRTTVYPGNTIHRYTYENSRSGPVRSYCWITGKGYVGLLDDAWLADLCLQWKKQRVDGTEC